MKYDPQDLQGIYDRRAYLSRDAREATTVKVRKPEPPPLVKGGQGRELDRHEIGALWIAVVAFLGGVLLLASAIIGR